MARKLLYNEEEGGMAKAQLQKIEMYAAKLNEMIHPDDELEGWVQNKLSVVAAYMGDVKHYLDYALQNEPEYKEMANGGMTSKPLHWEVEFTWDGADEESRKVNVMADSVSEAEEQVRMKFGPYYKGLKVVEVEEDKEMTWEEYETKQKVRSLLNQLRQEIDDDKFDEISDKIHQISDNEGLSEKEYDEWDELRSENNKKRISKKFQKKFEIESTTDYDTIEADDEDDAREKWMKRRSGDSIKSEILKVRQKYGDTNPLNDDDYDYADGGMVYDIEWVDIEGDTLEASFESLEEAKEELKKIREEGGRVKETWKYRDGKYVGSFGGYADGGVLDDLKNQGVKKEFVRQAFFAGGNNGSKAASGKDYDTYEEWLKKHKIKHHIIYKKAFEDGGKAGFNLMKGKDAETFEEWQKKIEKQWSGKMADGGMMRLESSTMEEDMQEAEDYIGREQWNSLSEQDKINATQYLKAKGKIGYYGQEEELMDVLSAEAYRSGGSIYRGMRPSPSVSATAYPEGHRMMGNDGNLWEIAINSAGTHRWVRVHGEKANYSLEREKVRKAIEILESMRGDIDVDDEIAALKKTLK